MKKYYQKIRDKHRALKARSKTYKATWEWVSAIVFATVVASLVHLLLFQMYVIPSSSMEKSLLRGDYLYVSKLSYGPKMPNTPIAFPFVHHTMPFSKTAKSFCDGVQWKYRRWPGVKQIKRGDVVVFNFPEGDTVLLDMQDRSYYSELRAAQSQLGRKAGRQALMRRHKIVVRPVDKRENYIKRCIALPGDTLRIVRGDVFVNEHTETLVPDKEFLYTVSTMSMPSVAANLQTAFRDNGITEWGGRSPYFRMNATEQDAAAIAKLKGVESVQKELAVEPDYELFPHDTRYGWNVDNYGPLWIPSKGATVELTHANLPLYRRIIETYEGHTLTVDGEGGTILIDGQPATEYTFAMDYYWMMGDNRHNSADSRFWGFVPEDHIVGKASFTWLSLDPDKKFPGNIRWKRMFKKVR